jgi:succinate-semialdehyde dehydrogenase/glutarate-semialdehyde dehydrogenase
LHRAASGAVWGGLTNCGQSCGGVERIYVHEKVYTPFLSALKAKVECLRMGLDDQFNVDLGVMTTKEQVLTVQSHVKDALSKGAKIFARSPKPVDVDTDNMLSAYVLVDVTHDMLVMKEETFGPVLAVMKVRDMDEAISLNNGSELGLTGSVWSKDRKNAEKLGRRIQAGVITINDHLMSHGLTETPWGGIQIFRHRPDPRCHWF